MKKNEAVLYTVDLLPKDYVGWVTEINTNTALDEDLIEWFDFDALTSLCSKWEYKNLVLLCENGWKNISPSLPFCNKLSKELRKKGIKFHIHYSPNPADIWDGFEYNSKEDFILRVGWSRKCEIDQLARNKLKTKKLIEHLNVYPTPEYYTTENNGGFKKNKWYVFKKSNVDRKQGVEIRKFKTKKAFITHLKDFDYCEDFIDAGTDVDTGLKTEIKSYGIIFKKEFYDLTPNLYCKYWEYEDKGNEKLFYKINPTNCIIKDEVELADDSKKQSFLLEKGDNLKLGGKITKIDEFDSYINKSCILINNEYKFTRSTNVVKCGHLSQYTPVRFLEVGDKILRENMEELEIKQIEEVKGVVRGKMIRTAENVMSINGFFVKAQSSNNISGLDDLIFSPKVGQVAMSWSDEEQKVVSGIMNKVEDEKMPSRVVEITFNTGGHIWTAEFLFEKPLKVIYSADPEGLKLRAPKEKFFGWASYRPDITRDVKHMDAMQLMPGMQCITPKRPDMEVTETLYGDMVASVVVSMREVVGKRSHWDIYEMKPMDTPNPNYFMNRLHVHNGPSNWPMSGFGGMEDVWGHWDISHSSSFPTPSHTIYDLTSKGNVDGIRQPGTHPVGRQEINNGHHTTTQNTQYEIPMWPRAIVFLKQPGNPYHTNPLGFFGSSSFTIINTWRGSPGPNTYARLNSTRPGYKFEVAFRSPGQMAWYVPGWRNVDQPPSHPGVPGPGVMDLWPAPDAPSNNPKLPPWPRYNITGVRYMGPAPTTKWHFRHGADGPGISGFGAAWTEAAPQNTPRTGENRWGVFGNVPGPTSTNETLNGYFSEMLFIAGAQPTGNMDEFAEGILGYYNKKDPSGSPAEIFWQYPSDIRLKENIELVGNSYSGINIYEFEYKNKSYGDGRYRGVMAQEVPEYTSKDSNGYLMVDYSKLDVRFEKINK